MVETLTGLNRRSLNFPAIQPCEDISPNILLTSLIDLAAEIRLHKSKLFPTNHRNARESVRKIGVLIVFLEELRVSATELPYAAVLSLSELHVAFQKLRWLLEDCSREGSRVWILAKSELVADQFRVLSRAISTAMEVFPIDGVDIDEELKEHFELVMNQARNSEFNVDLDDQRILQIVNSVLIGFENGIIPNRDSLKLVLDYLGIKRWSTCHKEAKFLASEIEFESQSEESSEISMLSSLMGLISYCRCTIFDAVDFDGEARTVRRPSEKSCGGSLIGVKDEDLRCPISLEIMSDPVTIASGQSYSRVSIAKWFGAGNSTCPKTGEKLLRMKMVPNLAVQRVIQLYCLENDIPFVESRRKSRGLKREGLEFSSSAKKAMALTANFLVELLEIGTGKERSKAAIEIRILSKTSAYNQACLIDSGVIPPLLKLMLSSDPTSQENSSASLLHLSRHPGFGAVIFQNSGLSAIVDVLKSGLTLEAKQHAAGVLFYLATSKENRLLFSKNPGAIPGLIELIKGGTDRGMKNAMIAIFPILAHQETRQQVLQSGIVPPLINLLNSRPDSDNLTADSLTILSILAEESNGSTAILRRGGLDSAIRILSRSDSKMVKEHCVALLWSLCKNGENDVAGLLVKSTSLMGYLYLVLSEGSSRASKNASSLIRVLHQFSELKPSGLVRPPIFRQQRFIRAW